MLDKWFHEDLDELFSETNRVVIVDKDKQYDFLVNNTEDRIDAKIFHVDDYISDLEVKYTVEKEHEDENVLIHTYLDPADKERRQYMIQEYASTGKRFDRLIHRYIDEKSGLSDSEYNFEKEELIVAGKMSLRAENNNEEFWQNIKIEGRKTLLGDFIPTILRFLDKPVDFVESLPEDGQKILYHLIGEYLGISHDEKASPQVVADDIAEQIFDNIINDNKETEDIYRAWLDSHRYRSKLTHYLDKYELSGEVDIWGVDPNHPFKEIDDCWLEELSEIILSDDECPDYILEEIKGRYRKGEGMEIAESYYWKPIYILINFSAKDSHKIEDINEFIELYRKKLYKLDQAIRHINQYLLDKGKARRAFQALYEDKMNPYLRRWFELFNNYRENQSGYLPEEVFADGENKAVIVGDAISFEVAQEIFEEIDDSSLNIINKVISGDYPSTTANNMSSLFGSQYTNDKNKREQMLEKKLNKELQVENLDEMETDKLDVSRPTIIYTRDIDSISEKGHETAIKYYPTFIKNLIKKVRDLLDAGFAEVHLVTDHGFVCNFSIDEADKYSPPQSGAEIKDRYVLSNEYEERDDYVISEDGQDGYKYTYYPKGINPVKSRRQYGFAHGGITPQELLLPHMIFKKESSSQLDVRIVNKDNLESIGAKSFTIKLKAEEEATLLKQQRDIIIKIEDEGEEKFSQNMTIDPGKEKNMDLSLNLTSYLIKIMDAESKEIIDSIRGEKENLRSGLDEFDLD